MTTSVLGKRPAPDHGFDPTSANKAAKIDEGSSPALSVFDRAVRGDVASHQEVAQLRESVKELKEKVGLLQEGFKLLTEKVEETKEKKLPSATNTSSPALTQPPRAPTPQVINLMLLTQSEKLIKGQGFYDQKDSQSAIQYFLSANLPETHQYYNQVQYELGESYFLLKENDKAIPYLKNALESEKYKSKANCALGKIYYLKKDYPQAEKYFSHTTGKWYVEGRVGLAGTSYELKKYSQARRYLANAKTLLTTLKHQSNQLLVETIKEMEQKLSLQTDQHQQGVILNDS